MILKFPVELPLKLPPIAYFLLIAHLIFFGIVGSYALYVMHR